MTWIKLSLPPTTNNAYGNKAGGKGRYLKQEGKSWKWDTGWIVRSAGIYNLDSKYRLELVFLLDRDRDIDGSLKLLLDAMTGIVYNDDRQVVDMHIKKFNIKDKVRWYSIDTEPETEPCVFIYIGEVELHRPTDSYSDYI